MSRQIRRVFATAVGAITPNHTIDNRNLTSLNKTFNGQASIPIESLQELPYDGKGMMSQQTKLLMKAFQLAFSSSFLTQDHRLDAQVFVGNGPISLESRTIKSLIKFLTEEGSTYLNFRSLSENMERLPPLDGIKMLSTAPSHFCAKEAEINGPGQPIYNGNISGLTAFCLAFESIARGDAKVAIIASADAPLVEHTVPYLRNKGGNQEAIFLESAIVYILKAENALSPDEEVLFEVKDVEISTLPHTLSTEEVHMKANQKPFFSFTFKNNGFMDQVKHIKGSSYSLFDILEGFRTGEQSYIVCDQGEFGHFASVSIERLKK